MARECRVEHADRPEPAAEPGIKYVLVLTEIGCSDIRIDLLCSCESEFLILFNDNLSVRKVPGRYTLTPPQLAADSPVVCVLHPVAVSVAVFVRDELDVAAFHSLQSLLCKGFHLEEPL